VDLVRTLLLVVTLFGTVIWAVARQQPQVTVVPATAAPGEQVTIEGSGWPPGAQLTARFYEDAASAGDPDVALLESATMAASITAGSDGRFRVMGTVPRTLSGPGSRGNMTVVPGSYTVAINPASGIGVAARFTVGVPERGGFLWGEVFQDLNSNGRRDEGEPPLDADVFGNFGLAGQFQVIPDIRGRYAVVPLQPGTYHVIAYVPPPFGSAGPGPVVVREREIVRADIRILPPPPGTPPFQPAQPDQPAPGLGLPSRQPESPVSLPRTGRRGP